ncbi:MAG: universal stress protein [Deltaproteobacteria bacterium]|nr:universal stress protein [Deltaproteobacteria bacterium]
MYSRIMVPLDGSALAECVLPHVTAIAGSVKAKEVVLVRVVNPIRLPASVPATGDFGFREKDRRQLEAHRSKTAANYLQQLADDLAMEDVHISQTLIEGKVADSLADYAVSHDVDLIVMASHGRSGVSRWVMGSVAEKMVRSSCVPVLLVRAPGCEPRG